MEATLAPCPAVVRRVHHFHRAALAVQRTVLLDTLVLLLNCSFDETSHVGMFCCCCVCVYRIGQANNDYFFCKIVIISSLVTCTPAYSNMAWYVISFHSFFRFMDGLHYRPRTRFGGDNEGVPTTAASPAATTAASNALTRKSLICWLEKKRSQCKAERQESLANCISYDCMHRISCELTWVFYSHFKT